jgi:hypothetical protein
VQQVCIGAVLNTPLSRCHNKAIISLCHVTGACEASDNRS